MSFPSLPRNVVIRGTAQKTIMPYFYKAFGE